MTAFDTLVSVADFAEAISALFTVAGTVLSVQVAVAGIRYVRDVIEEETAPHYSPDGFSSDDAPYEYTQADWDAQWAELQAQERSEVETVDPVRYEIAKAEMAAAGGRDDGL
jgi:hypothetical protein